MRLRNVKGANEIIVNGKYYVLDPFSNIGSWKRVFGNNKPIYIEIGIGKGNFIIENAKRYPDINFIGIEKFDSVIVRAIQKSNELELENLRIVRMDAKRLGEIFSKEIDLIYLNFSDPWPKDRHSKRRLTSRDFLLIYDKIFRDDKQIVMKTDNIDLFNYSVDSLEEYGYKIVDMNNYLDCLREDNIMTEYEEKFYNKGQKINKLVAIKKNNKNWWKKIKIQQISWIFVFSMIELCYIEYEEVFCYGLW